MAAAVAVSLPVFFLFVCLFVFGEANKKKMKTVYGRWRDRLLFSGQTVLSRTTSYSNSAFFSILKLIYL